MIIITGMHRSGTSITANILYELNMNFGESTLLMEPDQWNPRGYYENTEIHILNDQLILGDLPPIHEFRTTPPEKRRLITRLIMTAFRVGYSLPGGHKRITERAARKQDEIRKMAQVYSRIAVKDPRFSITIGEWARYAKIDRVVYCYRHPYEVAISLWKRYHIPVWLGYRFWKTHVTEFFSQAKGLPIVLIHYGGYFSDAPFEELERLYRFAGKTFNEQDAQSVLDSVLSKELWHNMYDGQRIPQDIAALYDQLTELHDIYSEVKVFEEMPQHVNVIPARSWP